MNEERRGGRVGGIEGARVREGGTDGGRAGWRERRRGGWGD